MAIAISTAAVADMDVLVIALTISTAVVRAVILAVICAGSLCATEVMAGAIVPKGHSGHPGLNLPDGKNHLSMMWQKCVHRVRRGSSASH